MKKITLLLFTVVFSLHSYAQLALEGFEGATFPPTGWVVMDNGVGTVNSWTRTNVATNVYQGTWSAFMTRENIGQGNTSEDWLVTPQITVPTNGQLRFFARSTLAGNQGTLYQIRVSTNANQMAQGNYIIIQQYNEDELSDPFGQYEEKILSLAAFQGQSIYVAFVMQYTQLGTALSGDRWLLDNVEVVEQCIDPTNLSASSISQTGATLSWDNPGGATQFEVEVVQVPNLPTGSGILTPNNPVTTAQLGLTLNESTEYQFYVRAVCSNSNSLWIGPFDFVTKSPGETCDAPIVVGALPYNTTDNTSNYGDDYNGSPGPSGCGTNSGYLNGDDVFYEYTATFNGTIQIAMTPTGPWSGLFVYNSCANVGVSCIAGVANGQATPRVIELPVTNGTTYYIAISTWANPNPQNTAYNLTIQQVNCPPPTNLTAALVGELNYQLSWNNNGATQFEVEVVALPGTPTGSGILTTSNPVTTADLGITLLPNTQYQFYIRADCGDGTFSLWPPPGTFSTVLGENCSAPINVTSLPYSTNDNTENYGNNVTGAPGSSCGSTSNYLSGNDVFYSYTPQNSGIIEIRLTPNGTRSGLFVYNSCANVGLSCVAGVANTTQNPRIIQLPVTAGVTYYIVIS
ncbi:MAG: choice-of-anchor J domain-containing protein, partial [Flavobacterium sp.]